MDIQNNEKKAKLHIEKELIDNRGEHGWRKRIIDLIKMLMMYVSVRLLIMTVIMKAKRRTYERILKTFQRVGRKKDVAEKMELQLEAIERSE